MKKVLYLSNIEVPYRVRFFNELSRHCDLTVLYEREKSSNRNRDWTRSESGSCKNKFLHGIPIGGEHAFSLGILKELFSGYDLVIVGCYNSPVQMMAILVMRIFRIPYVLNTDGETFLAPEEFKTKFKYFFLKGAERYLIAGEKSAETLKPAARGRPIVPYYFSSLYEHEVEEHRMESGCPRNDTILVVGQYFDYKGMDVALEAARMDLSLRYKFVGMGARTEQFRQDHADGIPENVEIIPFLQKEELEKEYQTCGMLVLPSRRECWGLVINEAASFGTPIVSTWGSGAAVEFLADDYPEYLAKPGDGADLYRRIRSLADAADKSGYCVHLLEKSRGYTIEKNVAAHVSGCGLMDQPAC